MLLGAELSVSDAAEAAGKPTLTALEAAGEPDSWSWGDCGSDEMGCETRPVVAPCAVALGVRDGSAGASQQL